MRLRNIVTYALLGLLLGAAAGFSLLPLREREVSELGSTSILHLAVLGLLLAAPGPMADLGARRLRTYFARRVVRLFEIVTFRRKPRLPAVILERKLSAALITGAVAMNLLVVAVLYLDSLIDQSRLELLLFASIFAAFPMVLALVDCLMDELLRAVFYETLCAAIGGLAGLGLAWPVLMVSESNRVFLGLAGALYGASVWLFVGISKLVEEVEEEIEAAEHQKKKH
jgi:hypothetical protein